MLRSNRRRTPLLISLLAVVALLSVACKQDNTPSSYNDVTQQNFIDGCTGNTSDNGATGNTENAGNGPATTLAPTSACECAYKWIVLNVPYNDANKKAPTTIDGVGSQVFTPDYGGKTFQQINDDLQDNPGNVPGDIQTALAKECKSAGWNATTTTTASQGGGPTTVPG
jgi:hypothetical protein